MTVYLLTIKTELYTSRWVHKYYENAWEHMYNAYRNAEKNMIVSEQSTGTNRFSLKGTCRGKKKTFEAEVKEVEVIE